MHYIPLSPTSTCILVAVCGAHKLRPCPSYGRRRKRIHLGLFHSLDRGRGGQVYILYGCAQHPPCCPWHDESQHTVQQGFPFHNTRVLLNIAHPTLHSPHPCAYPLAIARRMLSHGGSPFQSQAKAWLRLLWGLLLHVVMVECCWLVPSSLWKEVKPPEVQPLTNDCCHRPPRCTTLASRQTL